MVSPKFVLELEIAIEKQKVPYLAHLAVKQNNKGNYFSYFLHNSRKQPQYRLHLHNRGNKFSYIYAINLKTRNSLLFFLYTDIRGCGRIIRSPLATNHMITY
ncbi:hypothetical protein D1872_207080 [compost metagenome]